jgi:plastocyanin
MRWSYFLFAVSVLLLFALLPAQAAEEKTFVAVIGPDGVQRVTITSGSYFFDPNRITVKANTKVELMVMKEGGITPHDIEMKSPEAGMEFSEGLSSTPKVISFTPTKPGNYPFFCGKKAPFSKSHRERGMEGIIEVVP